MLFVSAIPKYSCPNPQECFGFYIRHIGYYQDIDKPLPSRRENGRDDFHIILIEKGSLRVRINDTVQTASDGDMIYFPPHCPQIYTYLPTPDSACCWLHFDGCEADRLLREFRFRQGIYHLDNTAGFANQIREIVTVANQGKPGFWYEINARLALFLTRLGQQMQKPAQTRKRSAQIADIVRKIETSPEENLLNCELARQCGISEYHFIRLFKAVTGMSPKQYRISVLLEKAKHLLCNTDLNVSEISYILKIDDPLYFSRLFQKHCGVSPGAYRTEMQNE